MSDKKANGNGPSESNSPEKSEPKDLQVYEPVVLDDEKLGYFKTDVKGYEGDFIEDDELPSELKSEESQEERDS